MEKKYQVFVSSTYEDLIPERQEVMHALLELDCIPSGMELFPAADDEAWDLIKSVIDECDYYLLILAGRYGSGYTEREYRYALEQGKPIIAFLHKKPEDIAQKFTEKTEEGKNKLGLFRDLAQKKVCKFWNTPSELGSVASRSLVSLIKRQPGTGWVRGDAVISQDAAKEILTLRRKIEDLEGQLKQARTQAPPGTEKLAQGSDKFSLSYKFADRANQISVRARYQAGAEYEWDAIFYEISPILINEATEEEMKSVINAMLREDLVSSHEEEFIKQKKEYNYLTDFNIDEGDFQTIKVQLNALGLIAQSARARSVKDTSSYWTLTPYGNEIMTRLRAIERESLTVNVTGSENPFRDNLPDKKAS